MSDPFDPYNTFLSIMSEQAVSDTDTYSDRIKLFQQNENPDNQMYLSAEDVERILYLPDNETQEGQGTISPFDSVGIPTSCNTVIPSNLADVDREVHEVQRDHDESNILIEKVSNEYLEQYVNHLKDLQHQDLLFTDSDGCIYTSQETFLNTMTKIDSESKCEICSKPALKYSSYGGLACSSCRSFFRRSVQSGKHETYICSQDESCEIDPGTRRNCKYCRFHNSLRSGMKITWVLSEQEKMRRFSKLEQNKEDQENCILDPPKELSLLFSTEEDKMLKYLHSKFEVPWLENLLLFDREAGVNLLEYVYGERELKNATWGKFLKSLCLDFVRLILPTFRELDDLHPQDLGQILNSPTAGIAQFFISSYCIDIGPINSICPCSEPGLGVCAVPYKVKSLLRNTELVTSLDLSAMLSRLDLSKEVSDTRRPVYDELYPNSWVGDQQAEGRHKEAFLKMIKWPTYVVTYDKNMFDYLLVSLMTLILTFNGDFYTLVKRDKVEEIQMKYIMMLKRYIRSKLPAEAANTKFIEAMMLIAHTRQAWEISHPDWKNN